jgi:NhaP-type Na+/H+ or K+/H+ antiporter
VTWGNGLIAAFVCGIAMAAVQREVPEGFVDLAENTSAILQVLTFFVFGALIVTTGFHDSIPALVLLVLFALLLARPVAVLISFLRTGSRAPRSSPRSPPTVSSTPSAPLGSASGSAAVKPDRPRRRSGPRWR